MCTIIKPIGDVVNRVNSLCVGDALPIYAQYSVVEWKEAREEAEEAGDIEMVAALAILQAMLEV